MTDPDGERHQQSTLASGVRVVTQERTEVRSASLGIWVGVGSRHETAAEHGASHYLEHLLFKGTTTRSAREIARTVEVVGGDLNAFTTTEATCYHAHVLDRDAERGLEVLSDLIVNATNTDADVDVERPVVLEEINIHFDSPDQLVHGELAQAVMGEHGLAKETLGTRESIENMPAEVIRNYFERWYRPAQITVAAAGNIKHDDIVAMADKFIGDCGRPGDERPEQLAPPSTPATNVRLMHRPTDQAHMLIGGFGLSRTDPRRDAARVANVILGGGMGSRLFQNIRETHGLAYSTYSYLAAHTDSGWWGAYVGTSPDRIDQAQAALVNELDDAAASITDDEVAEAKGQLAGNIALGQEDPQSLMVGLGRDATFGIETRTLTQTLADIDAVTPDEVRAIANELYGGQRVVAVVGPFGEDEADRFAGV